MSYVISLLERNSLNINRYIVNFISIVPGLSYVNLFALLVYIYLSIPGQIGRKTAFHQTGLSLDYFDT